MKKIDIRKTDKKGVYEIRTINGWARSNTVNVGDYVYTKDNEITKLSTDDIFIIPHKDSFSKIFKRFIKYRYLRSIIWVENYKKEHNRKNMTDDQIDMIRIIKKSILDVDAELYVNNKKGISYVYIEPASVFCKIEYKYAYVTNSLSNYVLPIPDNEYLDIMKMYEKRKSMKMDEWERKIVDKNRKSLQQIFNALIKNQEMRKEKLKKVK